MGAEANYDAGAPKIDWPWVFSISQVETFTMCRRKWAFDKIDKLPREDNPAAELGGRVHKVLEDYLRDARPISGATEEGQIAIPGVQYLPLPMTRGMRVEDWFHTKIGNAYFRGKKDFEFIDGDNPFWKANSRPFWKTTERLPLVGDHKSTGNLQWRKTETDLAGTKKKLANVQSGIYAFDAHERSGKKSVALLWNYYRTKGARYAEPVRAIIHLPQIMRVVEYTARVSDSMIETHQQFDRALDVEPNYGACEAFGGCPHKDRCERTPAGILKAIMTQGNIDETQMQKLQRRKAEREAAAAAAAGGNSSLVVAEQAAVEPSREAEAPTGNGDAINPPESAAATEAGPPTVDDKGKKTPAPRATKGAAANATTGVAESAMLDGENIVITLRLPKSTALRLGSKVTVTFDV